MNQKFLCKIMMILLCCTHTSSYAIDFTPTTNPTDRFGSVQIGITQAHLKTHQKSRFDSTREALYIAFKKGSTWQPKSAWIKFIEIDGSVGENYSNGLFSMGLQMGTGYKTQRITYFTALGIESMNILIPDRYTDNHNAWGITLQAKAFIEVSSGFGLELGYKRGQYKSLISKSLLFFSNRWVINLAYYDFKL